MPTHLFPTPPIQYLSGFRKRVAVGPSWPMHTHASFEIVYHPMGRGYTQVKNTRLPFVAGSLVSYPPDVAHTQYLDEPGEDVCVLFAADTPFLREYAVPLVLAAPSAILIQELCALAETALPMTPDEQRELDYRMTTVACAIWRSLAVGSRLSTGHPYVAAAQQYMRTHYAHIQFLGEIAEHVGVSEDYLRHLFRAECGMSVRAWLTEVRIERAKELLRHFALPLRTVAELCGFANERYLSTVFSRHVGCPPGAYRTRMLPSSTPPTPD